uniref:SprT-like domain-containing protein n=1 Tax=Globodera pallida TaxID=36090 RepID=A0A183BQN8_GLOPA
MNLKRIQNKREQQKQRLFELFNRTGPLPGKGNCNLDLRTVVLEIQAIMLGIIEPHGRRRFPNNAQRVIYDYTLANCWAEWTPPGILDSPHHHFRFDLNAMSERHAFPWWKFVSTALHESLHCAARTMEGTRAEQNICSAMAALNPQLIVSADFEKLKDKIVAAFPFLEEFIDVFEKR